MERKKEKSSIEETAAITIKTHQGHSDYVSGAENTDFLDNRVECERRSVEKECV